jgi:Flp pilus assembly protein TadG
VKKTVRALFVLRASRGQVGAEFALVLAVLGAVGLMGFQFLDVALTAAKVNHAAQEAAYVAGSSLEAASGTQTPCWAVAGGLQHPDAYADAAICRTVLENLGSVSPDLVSVSVSPRLVERTSHSAIRVTVTYRQPISSPLLRVVLGETFASSSEASSWSG